MRPEVRAVRRLCRRRSKAIQKYGIAAAVVALVETQQLLVALALVGDGRARDLVRLAIGEVDVDQDALRDPVLQQLAR